MVQASYSTGRLNARIRGLVLALLVPIAAGSSRAWAEEPTSLPIDLTAILRGESPTSVAELKAMQEHVQKLVERTLSSVVAVQVGPAQGSGVIISPDGYVLTAAHVSGEAGKEASLMFRNGREVKGRTLGLFRTIDAGLIKINKPPPNGGEWPHVEMGDSAKVKPGQWCMAAGHPGGFQDQRPPMIRLGRILSLQEDSTITTDCTLIGGDSGGPLFNLDGQVIGVNSRIGNALTMNLHVPVNTYRTEWERLVRGDDWGHTPGEVPFIGVQGEQDAADAKVARVFEGTPAAEAGLQTGDIITRFGRRDVKDFEALQALVADEQPGRRIKLQVLRGDDTLQLELVIGKRHD